MGYFDDILYVVESARLMQAIHYIAQREKKIYCFKTAMMMLILFQALKHKTI